LPVLREYFFLAKYHDMRVGAKETIDAAGLEQNPCGTADFGKSFSARGRCV
jgi:hypothetical protein